jgi:hypothetical protein
VEWPNVLAACLAGVVLGVEEALLDMGEPQEQKQVATNSSSRSRGSGVCSGKDLGRRFAVRCLIEKLRGRSK